MNDEVGTMRRRHKLFDAAQQWMLACAGMTNAIASAGLSFCCFCGIIIRNKERKMFKYCLIVLAFLSGNAFASIDFSECEKVGYASGKWSVDMCPDIELSCDDQENHCDMPDINTPEGCKAFIDKMNKEEESDHYLLKCVNNDEFLSHKTPNFYVGMPQGVFISNDGTEINLEEILNDSNHIYLYHQTSGVENKEEYKFLDKFDKEKEIYLFNDFE